MSRYIKSLDGIRGFAALLILVAHILDTIFVGTSAFEKSHQIAAFLAFSGISLFFVLSGAVMQINYGIIPAAENTHWRSFIMKRVARLMPLYLLLLICYNGINLLLTKPLVGLTYLTLSQSWFNNMLFTFAPAWSISTEFFFYFGFIIITQIIQKIKSYNINFPLTAYFTFSIIIHILLFRNKEILDATLSFLKRSSNDNIWAYLSYYAPYTRILEFFLGMAVGSKIKKNYNCSTFTGDIIIGGLLSFVMITLYFLKTEFGNYVIQNFAMAPIWCSIILIALHPNKLRFFFENKFFVETGKISYGIYLLQFFVLTTCVILLPNSDFISKIGKVIGIVSLTYFLAFGSSKLFEQPAKNFLRRFS